MALNINIVNSTIIEVYQDSNSPRYYFGALGTSGKFYPSGTSGAVVYDGFEIISNTIVAGDNDYDDVPSVTDSQSGTPDILFYVQIAGGDVTQVLLVFGQQPS